MLIAYYPAWLLAHDGKGDVRGGGRAIGAYIVDFFTVEAWPVGPPWFLWVLLAFNAIFVWVYPYVKDTLVEWSQALSKIRTPLELVLLGYIITWVLYIPMMSWAGADAWTGIGPFDFQISRILLYFGYFIVGVVMGGGFVNGTMFVEKWRHWVGACLLAFALLKCSETPLRWMVDHHQIRMQAAQCIYRSMWCLSCVLSCMAFLVASKKIFQRARPWWNGLSGNAYGIYLVHYIFVIGCQYLLLGVDLPALVKFLITFFLSAAASWAATAAVRRIPGIKRVL
jgi:hypothetical protein